MAYMFFLFLLAFFTPTLSFCSLNTQFFTKTQIFLSLGLSLCVGITCAAMAICAALAWWPAPYISMLLAGVAAICFILLNERFFTETIAKTAARKGTQAGIVCFCLICAWFGWLFAPVILFSIYGMFAAYDLWKNWNREKTPLFDPAFIRRSKPLKNQAAFRHTPNVYLLLLESMHSSKALEEVYGIKSSAAEDCLANLGFKIYQNTFSNKHATDLSLRTILSMSLDYKDEPETLEQFVHNGYKCYFFDTMYYVSQPYIKYVSNNNCKLQPRIYKIYSFIGPFLAQSKWLRRLAGNIDPFETNTGQTAFPRMLQDFQTHIADENIKPALNILHFGASHFGDLWYRVPHPAETYMKNYENAVNQLRQVAGTIKEHDPQALVVAVGDHGAYHWKGTSDGPDTPEKNALRNGVAPAALAYDFFGVVLGIRWGEVPVPAIKIVSHVNIFRWIMAALSGQAVPDRLADNISILNGQYIVVRDGKPLEEFELLNNRAFNDYGQAAAGNPVLLQAAIALEQRLLQNDFSGLQESAQNLISMASSSPASSEQRMNAAKALVKAGYVDAALQLLETELEESSQKVSYYLFSYLVMLHLGMGNYARVAEIIAKTSSYVFFPKREPLLFLMQSLYGEARYAEILPLVPKLFSIKPNPNYEIYRNVFLETTVCLMAMEHAADCAAAEKLLDDHIYMQKDNNHILYFLNAQKLVLKLKNNLKSAVTQLRINFENDLLCYGFELLYLRSTILLGDMASARSFANYLDRFPALKDNPLQCIMSDEILPKGSTRHLLAIKSTKIIAEEITSSGLFDTGWYQQTYQPSIPPLMDYIRNGVVLLRQPNPDFDTCFYLLSQPAVIIEGINPLLHYIASGKSVPISMTDDFFIRKQVHPLLLKNFREAT